MLRQFAGLWLACFGGLALWHGLVRGQMFAATGFAILALTLGPIGLVRPNWIKAVYVAWMVLAFPIGWTVSQLVLALIYFGLFTPLALVFRLLGRDPLNRARRPDRRDLLDAQTGSRRPSALFSTILIRPDPTLTWRHDP